MASNFLEKQYGPFNGATWAGIVVGGAALAYIIRKNFSGAGKPAEQPIVVENVPAKGGGATYGEGDTGGPISMPPQPGYSPGTTPPKGTPVGTPRQCPPGQVWSTQRQRCIPANPVPPPSSTLPAPPVRPPAPAKPTIPVIPAPPPQAPGRAPGNYPLDCSGVIDLNPGAKPTDTSEAGIKRWIEERKAQGHSDHMSWRRAMNMAIDGGTGTATGRDLRNKYLRYGAGWLNGVRREFGLRALTQAEFDHLVQDFSTDEAARENTHFIQHLFDTYFTPYRCNTGVVHTGSRNYRNV